MQVKNRVLSKYIFQEASMPQFRSRIWCSCLWPTDTAPTLELLNFEYVEFSFINYQDINVLFIAMLLYINLQINPLHPCCGSGQFLMTRSGSSCKWCDVSIMILALFLDRLG
jgi:hypothetical protein